MCPTPQDMVGQLQSLLQRTLRALEVPDGVSASYLVALHTAAPMSWSGPTSGVGRGGRLQGVWRQLQLAWMVLQEGIEFFWLVRCCEGDAVVPCCGEGCTLVDVWSTHHWLLVNACWSTHHFLTTPNPPPHTPPSPTHPAGMGA